MLQNSLLAKAAPDSLSDAQGSQTCQAAQRGRDGAVQVVQAKITASVIQRARKPQSITAPARTHRKSRFIRLLSEAGMVPLRLFAASELRA
jgi:hypothetical protein